jgi:yecA family protein
MKHPLEQIYNQLLTVCAEPMEPAAIHGMLCAVAVVPGMVPPSVWMKAVYNMKGGTPNFSEKDQMNFIVNGLLSVADQINEGIMSEKTTVYSVRGSEPDDETVTKWAGGFLFGFNAVALPADEEIRNQYYALLSPFILWANPEMFAKAIEENRELGVKDGPQDVDELKAKIYKTFPRAITSLRTLSDHVIRHKR